MVKISARIDYVGV